MIHLASTSLFPGGLVIHLASMRSLSLSGKGRAEPSVAETAMNANTDPRFFMMVDR